jgi:UDP-N-acetylglucosamine transferase subunit ALG13
MPAVTPPGAMDTREPPAPRVMVTVGTEHFQFDRLIGWINDWLGLHPEPMAGFFVQWGAASIAPVCAGSPFLTAQELDELLGKADAVVCHGGPGSMADAWAKGHVPIVVPRLRRFGEAVDDHQVDFCVKLAGLGRVRLAQTPEAMDELLGEAVRDRNRASPADPADPAVSDVDAAVARFGVLVDKLVGQPRHRRSLLHRTAPRRWH